MLMSKLRDIVHNAIYADEKTVVFGLMHELNPVYTI